MISKCFAALFAICMLCWAQSPRAVRSQTASSFLLSSSAGSEAYEITNASYQVTGAFLPGRPKEQRLVLRKTTKVKQVIDEKGMLASITLEAWPLGAELRQKPIYSLTVSGDDGDVVDGVLFKVSRGLEDVEWWSVYQVGTGRHLFDTHVPLATFSISQDELARRYIGLEVPPDDATDTGLKDPRVVGVLSYSSAEKLIQEVIITCDDPERARLFRSYFDMTRSVSVVEKGPARTLRVTFRESYPANQAMTTLEIPLSDDAMEISQSKQPAGFHVALFRR